VQTDFSVQFATQNQNTASLSNQLTSVLAVATISPPTGVQNIIPNQNAALTVTVVPNPLSFGVSLKPQSELLTSYLLLIITHILFEYFI
jgi:hypothetical protein